MEEKNIIFGQYGEWANIKFDAKVLEIKSMVDILIPFDYALNIVFVYLLSVKKGYKPLFGEAENSRLDISDFSDHSKCVESINKIRKASNFIWEGGGLVKDPLILGYEGYSPGQIYIINPNQVLSKTFFQISFPADDEYEDYQETAKEIAEGTISWYKRIISLVENVAENSEGFGKEFKEIIEKEEKTEEEERLYVDMNSAYLIAIESAKDEKKLEILNDTIQAIDENEAIKKFQNLLSRFGNIPPFVFVDPRLVDRDYTRYMNVREYLKNKYGWDLIKNEEELISEFIEEGKKNDFLKEWSDIRNTAINQIKEEIPILKKFLVFVFTQEKLEAIEYKLWNEIPKMIYSSKFRTAIWETGEMFEDLIKILYPAEYNKSGGSLYNTIEITAKEKIKEEYGENIRKDLLFINENRNQASHKHGIKASLIDFNKNLAQETLLRAQLVYCMLKSRSFGVTPILPSS